MTTPALRRVVRRETHSPRTVAMFVAVILLVLVLAYIAVELVLWLAAQPALLMGPGAAFAWIVGLPGQQSAGLVIAGAVVLALVGLVLLMLAVTPGRLSKQEMRGGARAVVVDNGVIAASLAQHVSEETGIARDRVTVGVGHRSVDVTVRPAPGVPPESDEVRRVVESEIDAYGFARALRTRVRIERPRESRLES